MSKPRGCADPFPFLDHRSLDEVFGCCPVRWSAKDKAAVVAKWGDGLTLKSIAATLQTSHRRVEHLLRDLRAAGDSELLAADEARGWTIRMVSPERREAMFAEALQRTGRSFA